MGLAADEERESHLAGREHTHTLPCGSPPHGNSVQAMTISQPGGGGGGGGGGPTTCHNAEPAPRSKSGTDPPPPLFGVFTEAANGRAGSQARRRQKKKIHQVRQSPLTRRPGGHTPLRYANVKEWGGGRVPHSLHSISSSVPSLSGLLFTHAPAPLPPLAALAGSTWVVPRTRKPAWGRRRRAGPGGDYRGSCVILRQDYHCRWQRRCSFFFFFF